jgi:cyclic pyranopterin phosphate synthase
MQDAHGRIINYLRLSITDRCNLRCRYCMPAAGVPQQQCGDILRYEEFLRIVRAAVRLGVRKVRITGGEPLVRKGVLDFLRQLSHIPAIEEIALTTNGVLLPGMALDLKAAGVERLNVSLDSLQAPTFAEITRGGSLSEVRKGLEAAQAAGLKLKLNMVVMRGLNDREILDFARLSLSHPWAVRFIEYMPTIREDGWRERLVSGAEILTQLRQHFQLDSISGGRFCGPAKPYRIAGAPGTVGIITPMSEHFCGSCNRIRVTATGQVKSCLFSEQAVELRPHLQAGEEEISRILQEVINHKPSRHQMDAEATMSAPFSMANIGG